MNFKEIMNDFVDEVSADFHRELNQENNVDYRKGYYAGAMYAALMLRNMLYAGDNND